MALFLANCTKQLMIFSCRVPGYGKILTYHIPSGRQEQIDKGLDLSPEQMISVIKFMEETYKIRNVTDLGRKLSDFDGLVYSTKHPVPSDDFQIANAALVEKQEQRSANEAVKSALGFEQASRDKRSGARLAKATSVEIVEDFDKRDGPTGNEISMNLEVTPNGHDKLKLN